jgi:hypothetical protein
MPNEPAQEPDLNPPKLGGLASWRLCVQSLSFIRIRAVFVFVRRNIHAFGIIGSAAERSTAGVRGGGLFQFLTDCSLTRLKKGSDEFTLAANRHFWKSFEPFAARNLRLQFQPICEEAKLIGRDLTAFDAFQ